LINTFHFYFFCLYLFFSFCLSFIIIVFANELGALAIHKNIVNTCFMIPRCVCKSALYEIVMMMINDAVRSPRHSLEDHVVQKECLVNGNMWLKSYFFFFYSIVSLLRQRGHAGRSSPRRQNLRSFFNLISLEKGIFLCTFYFNFSFFCGAILFKRLLYWTGYLKKNFCSFSSAHQTELFAMPSRFINRQHINFASFSNPNTKIN
jgi:hypothetical protein